MGDTDANRTKAARKLISLINQIPIDKNHDYDVLGFVYEFLLKNFAANAGKAGEFYTPYEASLVMSEIIANHLKDRENIKIYDPTSGSGSLLINIGKSISKHMDNPNGIKYYAQELIPNTYNLTRMNLVMRDILPDNIVTRQADTLGVDWPFFDENVAYSPVWVDGCCSNPPYSQNWDAHEDIRFDGYGIAPKSKADYAFLLHNLYHLKDDGIMTIVLPHGVLFRGGDEAKIRSALVEKNQIQAIIGLPANMFFGTGIPTIIMVLRKVRNESSILFVDASKGFIKEGTKNQLQAKDVRKIVDTVINNSTISKYSRLVPKSEIVGNEYNLNIPRYVDSSDPTDNWDIYATMFGGIPEAEIDLLSEYWTQFPSLRNAIFKNKGIPYAEINVPDIKAAVESNPEIISFIEQSKAAWSSLPEYLYECLIEHFESVVVAKQESEIALDIKQRVNSLPLIDYYDAYQCLDDCWSIISLDIETMQAEKEPESRFAAVHKIDEHVVIKKDSKTKEVYEKADGYMGRILPFDLVQRVYFASEKELLEALESEISVYSTQKEELLNSIDPNDKMQLVDDDGEIVVKKLTAEITKLKKQIKNGAEFDEGSYQDIILNINDVNEHLKALKKKLKETKTRIEEETIQKIESLTDEEIVEMLINKWINPLMTALNKLSLDKLNSLINAITALNKKYAVTYKDISNEISETEKSISTMLDNLTGNEYDMQGLGEFKRMLGGE